MSWRDTIQTQPPIPTIPIILTKVEKESIEDCGNIEHRGMSLRKESIEDAINRLERIAKWKSHPIADLLDWYKDDLQDLTGMSNQDLQATVLDYLDNITLYRDNRSRQSSLRK